MDTQHADHVLSGAEEQCMDIRVPHPQRLTARCDLSAYEATNSDAACINITVQDSICPPTSSNKSTRAKNGSRPGLARPYGLLHGAQSE